MPLVLGSRVAHEGQVPPVERREKRRRGRREKGGGRREEGGERKEKGERGKRGAA